jgi:hypothetical protein
MLTNDEIKTRISVIRYIYLLLACVATTVLLMLLLIAVKLATLKAAEGLDFTFVPPYMVGLIIIWLIYYGLRRNKAWITILIPICCAIALFDGFLSLLQPINDGAGLAKKFVKLIVFMFNAYQIYFFTKPEVKKFYNMRGTVIF